MRSVQDQARALAFYTGVLGFVSREDQDLGEFRWLTVAAAEDPGGPELLLEPNSNPAATRYQQSLHEQGIPAASFQVDDLEDEFQRLCGLGVEFIQAPFEVPRARLAVFDDTCGNLIQLVQPL